MKRLDRDLMQMASAKRTANCTLGLLNAAQNHQPEEQLLGAAALFLHLADFYRVSAQDAFQTVSNMMNDREGKARPEFQAIRPYMEGELR